MRKKTTIITALSYRPPHFFIIIILVLGGRKEEVRTVFFIGFPVLFKKEKQIIEDSEEHWEEVNSLSINYFFLYQLDDRLLTKT